MASKVMNIGQQVFDEKKKPVDHVVNYEFSGGKSYDFPTTLEGYARRVYFSNFCVENNEEYRKYFDKNKAGKWKSFKYAVNKINKMDFLEKMDLFNEYNKYNLYLDEIIARKGKSGRLTI